MSDILTKIVARKREEVSERVKQCSRSEIEKLASAQPATRGFSRAIEERLSSRRAAVIAEVKKASPSKGIIREDFHPEQIARSYEKAGAACLSVLTDVDFFQGSDDYLAMAKRVTELPVLRKDFIIDPYQIHEARVIGADCILLIASILDVAQLHEFCELAESLGLDVLLEVHNREELNKVLTVSPRMVGINNRDLKTFNVDLNTTLDMLGDIPDGVQVVTESGIHLRSDVVRMLSNGVYGFLVGEAFMREEDPGSALGKLFSLD